MTQPEIEGPLTILELRASNVKRLTVVRIKPDGSLVQVVGKNGNGKSSVLDSIWMALDWANSVKPAEPIRKGANEAMIKLDLGEIKATRTFRKTAKGELFTELRLEGANGANITSPQKLLDSLIGTLSFEPLEFMNGNDAAKFDALKSFVPDVNFDEVTAQNETDYAKRTDENRRAKELLAQAAGIIVPPVIGPKIDVAQVVTDLEAGEERNKTLATRRQRRSAAEADVHNLNSQARRIEEQMERLGKELVECNDKRAELERKLAAAEPLPEEIDTAALRAQITQAQTVNADLDKAERKAQLLQEAEQREAAAEALTAAMKARDEDVRAKIAAAKMPVPGLSLADGKVFLEGIAIKDANRAAQLRLSVAVAMAKNPRLKVILIKEGGNDLDEDSMAIIAQMAEENGFQVWIERIRAEGGPPAIIMEDGHAKD